VRTTFAAKIDCSFLRCARKLSGVSWWTMPATACTLNEAGGAVQVPINDGLVEAPTKGVDVLALDEAHPLSKGSRKNSWKMFELSVI
jgi:hypothetical protein